MRPVGPSLVLLNPRFLGRDLFEGKQERGVKSIPCPLDRWYLQVNVTVISLARFTGIERESSQRNALV